MLPDATLSSQSLPPSFVAPDLLGRPTLTTDLETGGIALNDPSQGLMVQTWRAWLVGSSVRCAPDSVAEAGGSGVELLNISGITELSLAFDQNMRPAIAYVTGGQSYLWWFDTQAGSQATLSLPGCASPFITMDDKREMSLATSDILLFYIKASALYYRQQRDRFTIERHLADLPPTMNRIVRAGMGSNFRLQVEVANNNVIAYDYTAVYSDLVTDTLYTALKDKTLPMFRSAPMAGVWRSKVFPSSVLETYGWLRVNGDFTGSVEVRVYADGALFMSASVDGRTPVRVPTGRFKLCEVEVISTSDTVSVTLATTAREMANT